MIAAGVPAKVIREGKTEIKRERFKMAKKVLIISTSLRGGSNSDILAKECEKGAKEAGHEVEYISLKGKDIKFCIGCLNCQTKGICVLKDDVAEIMEKVLAAEVIVYATPIYYYEMSGQIEDAPRQIESYVPDGLCVPRHLYDCNCSRGRRKCI